MFMFLKIKIVLLFLNHLYEKPAKKGKTLTDKSANSLWGLRFECSYKLER
jgi:hypothetical protein